MLETILKNSIYKRP